MQRFACLAVCLRVCMCVIMCVGVSSLEGGGDRPVGIAMAIGAYEAV